MMGEGKFYSVRDLVNLCGQPTGSVKEAIVFLANYGFVQSFGQPEGIFTKTGSYSPGESVQLLKTLLPSISY